jgi:hypothetical protein
MADNSKDQFSKKEAQKRFEAALRGARITGHKEMSDISPKRNRGNAAKKAAAKKRK